MTVPRPRGFIAGPLAAAVLLTGCAAVSDPPRVLFNQAFIESAPALHAVGGADQHAPLDLSFDASAAGVVLDDPITVVRFVLRESPRRPVVRPSEGYYYFRFRHGHSIISGNLRFTDIEEGVLHTGYFDIHDPDRRLWAESFESGGARLAVRRVTPDSFEVRASGERPVLFEIPRLPDTPPVGLEPGERFVARVLDESGFHLCLMWIERDAAFLFALDDARPPADVLAPVANLPEALAQRGELTIGLRSRFAFWRSHGSERTVLVGVLAEHIRSNNSFDGPFDQVPPDLQIKPMLECAYPYVKARGGIDQHGNFVELEGQRVAISPYVPYLTTSGLIGELARRAAAAEPADGLALSVALTWEPKRAFDPAAPRPFHEFVAPRDAHARWLSQGWPANHAGDASRTWPAGHAPDASGAWPAGRRVAPPGDGRRP